MSVYEKEERGSVFLLTWPRKEPKQSEEGFNFLSIFLLVPTLMTYAAAFQLLQVP